MLALTLGVLLSGCVRISPGPGPRSDRARVETKPSGAPRKLPHPSAMSLHALARELHHRLERSAGQVSKLGPHVYHWSLPALETCTGSTALCRRDCYALELAVRRGPRIRGAWSRCLELSRDPRFPVALSMALARLWPGLLRIHVPGDFYEPGYLMAWAAALRDNPHVRPFAFTRAWRDPRMLRTIEAIGWPRWLLASTDAESGPPPARMREARMVPERMWSVRSGTVPPARGACPEQVVRGATCATCGRCPGARLASDGTVEPMAWPDTAPILFYMHGKRYRRRAGEGWHGVV